MSAQTDGDMKQGAVDKDKIINVPIDIEAQSNVPDEFIGLASTNIYLESTAPS